VEINPANIGDIFVLEIWKELNYNGESYPTYEVSNTGKIRNKETQHERVSYVDRRGYECITIPLSKIDGKAKYLCVKLHRAVACTFIPNPENKETVNHKDGNKLNNHVNNLEWNTTSENHEHSMEVLGNQKMFSKTMKRTFSRAIIQMDLNGNEVKRWSSCRDVERELGFAHENIAACARGKRQTAYGYVWKYV
jgi:hypothetical protein